MVIDSHAHIGKFNKRIWSSKELLASMDKAGVKTSVVVDMLGEQKTEDVVEAAKKFPRKIKAVGAFGYYSKAKKTKELKNLVEKKLIAGVKLYPGYEQFYPADKKIFPLYEFCVKTKTPVIFHAGVLENSSPGILKYSHPLGIDELAFHFPKLNIIIAHLGNPWVVDCAAIVKKNKNVYADLSGYFTEYISISKAETKDFLRDLDLFRSWTGDFKKVLFGTDWPIYSQKEYLEVAELLPMAKEEKDLVFWKNAKTLFRI